MQLGWLSSEFLKWHLYFHCHLRKHLNYSSDFIKNLHFNKTPKMIKMRTILQLSVCVSELQYIKNPPVAFLFHQKYLFFSQLLFWDIFSLFSSFFLPLVRHTDIFFYISKFQHLYTSISLYFKNSYNFNSIFRF